MANGRQVCDGNAGEAAHWPVHQGRNERTLPPFTGHLLAAAAIGRADRVALIGYGTRPNTWATGTAAIDGQARAQTCPRRCRARRPAAPRRSDWPMSVSSTTTPHVYRFTPGAGDLALSRIGVMLLAGPAAAFANMARSLGSRRRLAFVCWQNLAATSGSWSLAAVAPRVPLPPLDDQAGPGWFSLGERSRIGTVLRAAALSDVAIEHRGQRCTAIQPHSTALEWVYHGMRRFPRDA